MAQPSLFEVVFTLLFFLGLPVLFMLLGFLLFGAIYQAQGKDKTALVIEQMRKDRERTQEQIRMFADQAVLKMDTTAQEKMATAAGEKEEQKRKRRVNHSDPQRATSMHEDA